MSQVVLLSAGKREQTKLANRRAILDAAREVFAELGHESATVRDIIRRTGLASGTFYNYFRSLDEVFEALADDGAARFRPILRACWEASNTFEGYVRAAIQAYFGRRGAPAYAGADPGDGAGLRGGARRLPAGHGA
jgi:AcrR family transcriptional regulator